MEKGNFEIQREVQGVPYKGKYYAHYGIGTSLVMIPFYVAGKFFSNYAPELPGCGMPKAMTSLAPPLIMAFSCLMFYLFSGAFGYSRKVSALLTLIYGLTTMVWHL